MKLPTSQQETPMSKDIATAMIRMLEYGKGMNSNKTSKTRRNKVSNLNIEDLDLAEVYLKLEARAKRIEASKQAIEKMMKKDDKKDAKKDEWISTPRLAMLLVASFPITAPMYVFWLNNMMRAAGMK